MSRHSFQRRRVPLWQVAPLVLIPPAVVAAGSLYLDLPLAAFLYTCALSLVVLLLLVSPHSRLRWILAGAVALLGLIVLISGVNVVELAAAAFNSALFSLRGT
jgi:hypothetical protein